MDAFLREELERSLYVHFPLRVQEERAMETRLLKKKAEQEIILWDGSPEKIRGNGRGEAEISDGVLRIRANCRESSWPETENPNGIYATFGDYTVSLELGGADGAYLPEKGDPEGRNEVWNIRDTGFFRDPAAGRIQTEVWKSADGGVPCRRKDFGGGALENDQFSVLRKMRIPRTREAWDLPSGCDNGT